MGEVPGEAAGEAVAEWVRHDDSVSCDGKQTVTHQVKRSETCTDTCS